MSIPIFQFIPLPSYLLISMFVFYICDSISVLKISSFVPPSLKKDSMYKWYYICIFDFQKLKIGYIQTYD